VEERRFSAALSGKEDERALAPEVSALDIFRAFVKAGQRLAEIHVHYEQQPEYPLTKTEKAGEKLAIPHPERHPKRNLRIPPR
jgi:predicted helicase